MNLYDLRDELVWDEFAKQKEELGQLLKPTGLTVWDKLFGGIMLGTVSAVASTTGGGKSKFLRAMAKQLSRKYDEVILYITIEQSPLLASEKFKRGDKVLLYYMEDLKQWEEVEQIIQKYNIRFVMYDYIGALCGDGESEWSALKKDAARLNTLASKYNVAIMTALQATFELLDVEDLRDTIRNTKYVSFSKNMVNAFSQAIYLVNKPKKCPVISTLKNRYGEIVIDVPQLPLDYSLEEFVEAAAWN